MVINVKNKVFRKIYNELDFRGRKAKFRMSEVREKSTRDLV